MGEYMEEYNYVFVILVYRNFEDLKECIESIQSKVVNYRIIIVNAYYNSESENKVKKIAETYDCDFLSKPNKGYSYGNNAGIRYASLNYHFEYIIVSNPDIVINKFPDSKYKGDIIAPEIIAASGKTQNPMYIKYNKLTDWMVYRSFKNNQRWLLFVALGINKLVRKLSFFLNRKNTYSIYAAHGSFVLLSNKAVTVLSADGGAVYDENIFLFAEEMVLAAKARKLCLKTIFDKTISVFHKEDGSMNLSNISIQGELAKGNIYYYEHYIGNSVSKKRK